MARSKPTPRKAPSEGSVNKRTRHRRPPRVPYGIPFGEILERTISYNIRDSIITALEESSMWITDGTPRKNARFNSVDLCSIIRTSMSRANLGYVQNVSRYDPNLKKTVDTGCILQGVSLAKNVILVEFNGASILCGNSVRILTRQTCMDLVSLVSIKYFESLGHVSIYLSYYGNEGVSPKNLGTPETHMYIPVCSYAPEDPERSPTPELGSMFFPGGPMDVSDTKNKSIPVSALLV